MGRIILRHPYLLYKKGMGEKTTSLSPKSHLFRGEDKEK